MLSKTLFNWLHKVALFAIVFASIAPSVSHAIATQQGINSFAQEVCTSNGKKIAIQVMTTKGQLIATNLTVDEAGSQSIASLVEHLNHCPFCANPNAPVGIEPPQALIITLLALQAQQHTALAQPVIPSFSALPPPAQAPPSFK
jgi:hypothetical protein